MSGHFHLAPPQKKIIIIYERILMHRIINCMRHFLISLSYQGECSFPPALPDQHVFGTSSHQNGYQLMLLIPF